MSRPKLGLMIALLLGVAAPALAGGEGGYRPNSPWHNFWVGWHRNNCWPEPFTQADTASVWNMIDAQTAKGWEVQNMLSDAHFEADNTRLSAAGRLKVHAIMTQDPVAFRTVFVARGWTDEITQRRLVAAEAGTAQLVGGDGPMPAVLVSNSLPATTSADSVAGVSTWYSGFQTTIPKPQIKAFQQDDDSGGGGP
jgi:hypothetical protein